MGSLIIRAALAYLAKNPHVIEELVELAVKAIIKAMRDDEDPTQQFKPEKTVVSHDISQVFKLIE